MKTILMKQLQSLQNLVACILLLSICLAMNAHSQGNGSIEVGFDAGVNIQFIDDIDDTEVQIGLPSQSFGGLSIFSLQTVRLGFHHSDRGQVETTFGVVVIPSGGFSDDTFTHLGFGVEPLLNLGSGDTVPYIKGGGLFRLLAGGSDSEAQFGFRGGGGVRVFAAKRVAIRMEGTLARWFETSAFRGHWDVGASIGLSVYTK